MASEGMASEGTPPTDEDISLYYRMVGGLEGILKKRLIGSQLPVNTDCEFYKSFYKEHIYFTPEQMKADIRITKEYIEKVHKAFLQPENCTEKQGTGVFYEEDSIFGKIKVQNPETPKIRAYIAEARGKYDVLCAFNGWPLESYGKMSRRKRNKGKGKGKGKGKRKTLRR